MGNNHSVVITHESRVEALEDIAKSYLVELSHSLEQAKIAHTIGALKPDETLSMIEVRVSHLQRRVDSLTCKLEKMGVL